MPAPRPRSSRLARVAVAAAALVAAAGPLAAERIRATVDRNAIDLGGQILLTVTLEKAGGAQPVLPDLEEFSVHQVGKSTQMSFVNGRASSQVSYNWALVPRRAGVFTIGPATVEIDGETYATRPFEVRVGEPGEVAADSGDLFVRATVSTATPYVGQQVIYRWAFYRRVQVADARLEPSDFASFLVEDLGEVREYRTAVDGVDYQVSEIRKAIFPQEEGRLVIPASTLACQVLVRVDRGRSMLEDFFGRTATETRVLRTAPIELEVQPLPPPPPDFTGLVGRFQVAASLARSELAVGESTTLRLTVSGVGNVQAIPEPALAELGPFKVYDDKPSGSIDRSGSELAGEKKYVKALVPLAAGELTVPPARLTFFDPGAGAYRTAASPPLRLSVAPAAGAEELRLTEAVGPGTGKVAVRILADDILPLHDAGAALSGLGAPGPLSLGVGLAAPPVLALTALAVARRRRRLAGDRALRRRRRATRAARRRLAALGSAAAGAEAAGLASAALRHFIGDKLDLEGGALTPAEAAAALESAGADAELVREVRDALERLDAARYGGGEPAADLARATAALVARIDLETGP